MNVDDVIAERIAAARRRTEAAKRRRAALAAARQRGLARRHAAKLRNLNRGDTPAVAAPTAQQVFRHSPENPDPEEETSWP